MRKISKQAQALLDTLIRDGGKNQTVAVSNPAVIDLIDAGLVVPMKSATREIRGGLVIITCYVQVK